MEGSLREQKKKREKIEDILNHQVSGEVFIGTPAREWKKIVLAYFNHVHRGDITPNQLLSIMRLRGGVFLQKDSLAIYPVKECLKYISKVSNKPVDF